MKKDDYLLSDINLGIGEVVYYDFDLDPNLPIEEQKWSFKEDLVQIKFKDIYILDVGWYPEFDAAGAFAIEIIKNFDWDAPLFKKECTDFKLLKIYIEEAVNLCNFLSTNNK